MSEKLKKVKKKAIKLGASSLEKSTRKNKKYMVNYKNKIIHFGQKGYEDFLDHKDPDRRNNYLTRAKGIKNKKGQLTYNNPFSSNYWSINILW